MMRAYNLPFPIVITFLVFAGMAVLFILANARIVGELTELDDRLLIWTNSHHSNFLDQVMLHAGNFYFWVPFYCFLLLMVLRYDKVRFMRILPFVLLYLGLQVLFLLVFNAFFQHLRPLFVGQLRFQLQPRSAGRGASYGCIPFASITIGIALFFSLYFRQRYWLLKLILMGWAVLILYSFLYNGWNYPNEVLLGCIMATGLSYSSFRAYKHYLHRYYAG